MRKILSTLIIAAIAVTLTGCGEPPSETYTRQYLTEVYGTELKLSPTQPNGKLTRTYIARDLDSNVWFLKVRLIQPSGGVYKNEDKDALIHVEESLLFPGPSGYTPTKGKEGVLIPKEEDD